MSQENYLYQVQFLEQNFLVPSQASLNLGDDVSMTTKPISYKFGGSAPTGSFDWTPRTGVRGALWDLSFNPVGQALVCNIDLGTPRRSTNFLIRIHKKDTDDPYLSEHVQGVLECTENTVFPSNLDASTYNVDLLDDTFFLRRVSREYWYVNLPRELYYRYYRIKLYAPNVATMPTAVLKDVFLGDSVDIGKPPSVGLSHSLVDPSVTWESESGRKYFHRRQKFQRVNDVELPLLLRWQVSSLKIWSDRVGITDPFWAILDPDGNWDGPLYGASFGTYRLTEPPKFDHVTGDYWSARFSLEEAL